MTPQQLAFIACRLFAVYWVLNYVLAQGGLIFAVSKSDGMDMIIPIALGQIATLVMGLAFWFAAGPLAHGVVSNMPSADEIKLPDSAGWQALIIMALGAYGLFRSVLALPNVIMHAQHDVSPILMSSGVVMLSLISGILLLFPRKLANALRRLSGDKT